MKCPICNLFSSLSRQIQGVIICSFCAWFAAGHDINDAETREKVKSKTLEFHEANGGPRHPQNYEQAGYLGPI